MPETGAMSRPWAPDHSTMSITSPFGSPSLSSTYTKRVPPTGIDTSSRTATGGRLTSASVTSTRICAVSEFWPSEAR